MDNEWLRMEVHAAFVGWTGRLPNSLYGAWVKLLQVVKMAGRGGVTARARVTEWCAKANVTENDLAQIFAAAGENIQVTPDAVTIPNWWKYQLDRTNSERQQRHKKRHPKPPVTAGNGDNGIRDGTGRDVIEEKKKGNAARRTPITPADAPLPMTLNDPEMQVAWANWFQARREKGKPITATAAKQQIDDMLGWGRDRALAALRHSTGGNYQGLFEPSNGKGLSNGRTRTHRQGTPQGPGTVGPATSGGFRKSIQVDLTKGIERGDGRTAPVSGVAAGGLPTGDS